VHPPDRRDRRLPEQVCLYRPMDCDQSCRNRHPASPEEWCSACNLGEDDLTEQQAREHDLEVAAARHAETVPASFEEWWLAVEAGEISNDEGKPPECWGAWADHFRYTASRRSTS